MVGGDEDALGENGLSGYFCVAVGYPKPILYFYGVCLLLETKSETGSYGKGKAKRMTDDSSDGKTARVK